VRLGLREREDNDHLIDVCDDDPFAGATAWRPAREARPAWVDLGNGPRATGFLTLDGYVVADSEFLHVFLFEPAAHGRFVRIAV
jgi:hypothetical protein